MSKVTNRTYLPDIVVEAMKMCNESYTGPKAEKNIISVTSLLDSPYIRMLKMKHGKDVSRDVKDSVWALFGTAFHDLMERAAKRNPQRYLAEYRMKVKIGDIVISGELDLVDKREKVILDHKTTSVNTLNNDRIMEKNRLQLNIYYWMMLALNPRNEMKGLSNLFFFKDHNKLRNAGVPAIKEHKQKILEKEEVFSYIKDRIALHTAEEVSPCSLDDRWADKPKYAIMKKGLKRAKSLLDTNDETEATKRLEEYREKNATEKDKPESFYLEKRESDLFNRCNKNFCDVRDFCKFYQSGGKDNDSIRQDSIS